MKWFEQVEYQVRAIAGDRIPRPLRGPIQLLRRIFGDKYSAEMAYWRSRFRAEGETFKNGHYRRLMLAMAEETEDSFLQGKTVADFGCGPRGSLAWADGASLRIGIDVLADRYIDEFGAALLAHDMVYLKSTEKRIPLPSACVDVLFSINALDHVDSFPAMAQEILRVLKPRGDLIASFNVGEPKTVTEPQMLTVETIDEHLVERMTILSYRISKPGPPGEVYQPFFDGELHYKEGERGVLWLRCVK